MRSKKGRIKEIPRKRKEEFRRRKSENDIVHSVNKTEDPGSPSSKR
jgi:hypothetical protein